MGAVVGEIGSDATAGHRVPLAKLVHFNKVAKGGHLLLGNSPVTIDFST